MIPVVKKFGIDFKKALLFDRISEELRKFCAENTIDDVYNARFNDIAPLILNRTRESLERLAPKSIEIINLVIVKPDIPKDLAEKYKQVNSVYFLVCHVPFPAQGAVRILDRAGNHMTDQQIYFFRMTTLCTHLSGTNLSYLKVFLP